MENDNEKMNQCEFENGNMIDAVIISLNAARVCYSMSKSLDDLTYEYQCKARRLTTIVRRSASLANMAANEARAIYGVENYGESGPASDDKLCGYKMELDELRENANELKQGGCDEI